MGLAGHPAAEGAPRGWWQEVLRGAFEASTLLISTVEAMGEHLGNIAPSRASALVLALLARQGIEAPVPAAAWLRISL